MREMVALQLIPSWLRTTLLAVISALTLAYMAAPLWGMEIQMPTQLEFLGVGVLAYILGLDLVKRG